MTAPLMSALAVYAITLRIMLVALGLFVQYVMKGICSNCPLRLTDALVRMASAIMAGRMARLAIWSVERDSGGRWFGHPTAV